MKKLTGFTNHPENLLKKSLVNLFNSPSTKEKTDHKTARKNDYSPFTRDQKINLTENHFKSVINENEHEY
jgi:transposase